MIKKGRKMDKIARFPEFTPLDISHRDVFEKHFLEMQPAVSEFNFTEIFAWHSIRETKITVHNCGLFVYLNKAGKKYFYPPFGKNCSPKSLTAVLDYFLTQNEETHFYGFDSDGALMAEETGKLTAIEDRDNADYVYSLNDLITLSGRKYDGKRNHLKNFYRNNDFEFVTVTSAMIPEVMAFQKQWCLERGCEDDLSLKNEGVAVMEVLNNFDKLNVFGAIIKINGKIEAFTAASELNSDTAVVLFEKGNPGIRGIYQAINKEFCERMLSKYKWVNREQDGGDEGLRKAKLSYNPDHLVSKYVVKLKA